MSGHGADPGRWMGCLFALIAAVFAAIAALAGLTAMVARATEGQADTIRGLWMRAAFSVALAVVAIAAAVRAYRGTQ